MRRLCSCGGGAAGQVARLLRRRVLLHDSGDGSVPRRHHRASRLAQRISEALREQCIMNKRDRISAGTRMACAVALSEGGCGGAKKERTMGGLLRAL